MTTLLLVRHGLSEANSKGFFAGQMDVPLLKTGMQQAQLTAQCLAENYHIDGIYASDLKRAFDTAMAAAELLKCPITVDAGLREIYAGQWQGVPFDTLVERYPDAYRIWREDIGNAQCTGGESVNQMGRRVLTSMTEIAQSNDGKTLLIATHATPIRAMQSAVAYGDFAHMKKIPWVANASYSVLTYNEGIWQFQTVSEDAHLKNLKTVFPGNV